MAAKIKVVNESDGSSLMIELESYDTVDDLLASAGEFWQKQEGMYVVRKGTRLLIRGQTAAEAGLADGDVVEIVPDPAGG